MEDAMKLRTVMRMVGEGVTTRTYWTNAAETARAFNRPLNLLLSFVARALHAGWQGERIFSNGGVNEEIWFAGAVSEQRIQAACARFLTEWVTCGACGRDDTVLHMKRSTRRCRACGFVTSPPRS